MAKTEREASGIAGSETRSAAGSIEVAATPEQVWRALTEAGELERWFPLEARVEPGVGGSVWLSWRNEYAASSQITVWEPARRLAYSWGWSADEPPQVTEFTLEGRGGSTVLRVVTSGFPADASWDDWVEGTRLGWSFELRSLRSYLEDHAGEARHVAYVRARIPAAREEVTRRLFGPGGLAERAPAGRPFDTEGTLQFACEMRDLPGGLFRISADPSPDDGPRMVTIWASAWGDTAEAIAGLGDAWRGHLERAFPEGRVLPD